MDSLFRFVFLNKYLNRYIFKFVHMHNELLFMDGVIKTRAHKYKNLESASWLLKNNHSNVLAEKLKSSVDQYNVSITIEDIKIVSKTKDYKDYVIIHNFIKREYPLYEYLLLELQPFLKAIQVGNLEIVKFIHKSRLSNGMKTSSDEPIQYAILYGHYDILEYLYDNNFSIIWSDCLFNIFLHGKKFIEFLLKNHYYKYHKHHPQQLITHYLLDMNILTFYCKQFDDYSIIQKVLIYKESCFKNFNQFQTDLIDYLVSSVKLNREALAKILEECIKDGMNELFDVLFKEFKLLPNTASFILEMIEKCSKYNNFSHFKRLVQEYQRFNRDYKIELQYSLQAIELTYHALKEANFHIPNFVPSFDNMTARKVLFKDISKLQYILSIKDYREIILFLSCNHFMPSTVHPDVAVILLKEFPDQNLCMSPTTVNIHQINPYHFSQLQTHSKRFATWVDKSILRSGNVAISRVIYESVKDTIKMNNNLFESALLSNRVEMLEMIMDPEIGIFPNWEITQEHLEFAVKNNLTIEIIQYLLDNSPKPLSFVNMGNMAIRNQNISVVKLIHLLNQKNSFDKYSVQTAISKQNLTLTKFLFKNRTEGTFDSILTNVAKHNILLEYVKSYHDYKRNFSLSLN